MSPLPCDITISLAISLFPPARESWNNGLDCSSIDLWCESRNQSFPKQSKEDPTGRQILGAANLLIHCPDNSAQLTKLTVIQSLH